LRAGIGVGSALLAGGHPDQARVRRADSVRAMQRNPADIEVAATQDSGIIPVPGCHGAVSNTIRTDATPRWYRFAGFRCIIAAVTASDAVPVIIGAAIGAGGAVLAQITASVFLGRTDTKRLRWERQRQLQDWDIRRAERFLDLKRQLYSEFALIAQEFLSYINVRDPAAAARLRTPSIERLNHIQANIDLIAPENISAEAHLVTSLLTDLILSAATSSVESEQTAQNAALAQQALLGVRIGMGTDLRGNEPSAMAADPIQDVLPRAAPRWQRFMLRVRRHR
jgi:hypothetical protein